MSTTGNEEVASPLATPQNEDITNEIPGFFVQWMNGEGEREEGPLSLLWRLIESYRVDIFDVSLRKITEDFIDFLRRAEELKVELASPFVVMAARLLFYKSKALLPDPGFEDGDGEPGLPPELVQQLIEYRRFQMAAQNLGEVDDIASGMFIRTTPFEITPSDEEPEEEYLELDLVDLIRSYSDMLHRLKGEEESDETGYEISLEIHSVEEKMEEIRHLLMDAVAFSFFDLFENPDQVNRADLVVSFLAILELVKLSEILVRQHKIYGDIEILKKSASVR